MVLYVQSAMVLIGFKKGTDFFTFDGTVNRKYPHCYGR